jgi:hypothetical protein
MSSNSVDSKGSPKSENNQQNPGHRSGASQNPVTPGNAGPATQSRRPPNGEQTPAPSNGSSTASSARDSTAQPLQPSERGMGFINPLEKTLNVLREQLQENGK